jgi:SpoIID/LytB domain protein
MIRVMAQDGKLLVINDLPVEWYLKGMWEVSNGDLSEKIKTIVVASRSYAKWYMDPLHRKFSTRLYDGSDNPDEFQKYLGYSYEMRSPNVSKAVDLTRNQVIVLSGSLIKPWYFSSSDGRTLSALEYCQNSGWKNCVDIPYLQSVTDPGWLWKTRSGHGVGISGVWATYFANQWWDYKKIIQYYLNWVEIIKK